MSHRGYTQFGPVYRSQWFPVVSVATALAFLMAVIALGMVGRLYDPAHNDNVHNLTVTGVLDLTAATVKAAPRSIVIGTPTAGVDSFPVTDVATRKRIPRTRPPTKRAYRDVLPQFPGYLPSGPFPPTDAVHVGSFHEALILLQGKVINETTIYVHPGTYTENVHFDGFFGRCSFTSSSLRDSPDGSGNSACRGLIVVGDNRAVAAASYMHGGFAPAWFRTDLLGNWGGAVSLSCDTDARSITVTVTDGNPDFEALGVVANDLVMAYNASTDAYTELTVESVSANTVVFTSDSWPAGDCPVGGGAGSMITFLPNRIIQGKGYPVACSDLSSPDDLFMPVSVMDTGNVGLIYGFHVKAPPPGECVHAVITSNDQGSAQLTNIAVSDTARGTRYRAALIYVATQTQFLPYVSQVVGEPYGYGPISGAVMSVLGNLAVFIESQAAVTMGTWNIIGHINQAFGSGTQYVLELNMHAPTTTCAYYMFDGNVQSEIMFLSGGTTACLCMSGISAFAEVYGQTTMVNENSGAACVRLSENAVMTLSDAALGHSFSECDVGFYVNQSASLNIGTQTTGGIGTFTNVDTILSMSDTAEVSYGAIAQRPAMNNGDSGPLMPDFRTQHLDGTAALVMTMTAPLSDYLYKEYAVFSRTAYAHNITLVGATWDGTNTVATFPGTVGAGIEFRVLSTTLVTITANIGSVILNT
jgi:hypothetical protein